MARGGTVIGRFFELAAHKTDVRTDVIAGITTFLAMALRCFELATGRSREAHPLVYLFAGLFIARYVWL